jgi:negative modulator of initiation of replication
MKTIQIDDDLYQFIAANTQNIGESASDILRRLLWESTASNQVNVDLNETGQVDASTPPSNIGQDVRSNDGSVNNIAESVSDKVVVSSDAEPAYEGSVFNLLNREEIATQKGAVGRFLFVLSKLHRTHQTRFGSVLDIRGRERHYFGRSAEELEASGSSIKPKQIPNSEFWVTTNNNTPRKKFIIFEVAKHLGYAEADAEKLREMV